MVKREEFVPKDPLVNKGNPSTTVELSHTPSPWRLEPEHTDEMGNFIEARVWYDGDGSDANPQRHIAEIRCGLPESEANGFLIEKSPDLLAALMKIAAWDDRQGNDTLARTGSYEMFDEPGSVKIAREALAGLMNK